MVDVDLVVQRQRMVANAPVVADPRKAIDNERIDIELNQPSGDSQSVLAGADDQHCGIAIGVRTRRHPLVEPVFAAEIA